MPSVTLNTRYRPVRIGFCVRNNDLESVLTATDLAHTIWGGRFCPIVPCDDPKHAADLIDSFGVDTLYAVKKGDEQIDRVIQRYPAIPWPTIERGFFNESDEEDPQFLSVTHPMRLLRARQKSATAFPTVLLAEWEEDDPLAPWLCALVGRYADTKYANALEVEFRNLWPKHFRLRQGEPLPADLMHQITPNSITAIDIQLSQTREKAVYIASGDIFYDIVTFWNLRAVGHKMAFYSPTMESRLVDMLSRFAGFDDEMRVTDSDAPVAAFARDKNLLTRGRFADSPFASTESFPSNFRFAPTSLVARSRSVLASIDGEQPPTIDFRLPEKPFSDDVRCYRQHVVFEVTSYRNTLWQSDHLFPPPPVAALNQFYGRNVWYHPDAVRVIPQGLAFFVRATEENLQVRGVDIYAVVEQLFALGGLRVARSKAGLVARQLIQQMGRLQDCRVFKIPGVRALIEKYTPTQSFVRSEAIQLIRESDFDAHKSLYIERRTQKSLTPEDVFAFLLNKEVFRAGLELECPYCQLSFWRSVDDCITKLPCEFCGRIFNITPQLRHRGDWRFRRSGLFGAANHQEGSVPVALTLQQIEANLQGVGLAYTTALNLEVGAVKCETDFVIVHSRFDGTVEIVLSECKTRQEISQQDVENLSAVGRCLAPAGLKVFIVFSKTGTFSAAEIEICKSLKVPGGGGAILLSARELEPYFMYERTAGEFDISPHSASFEGMMEATSQIYLDPRPRPIGSSGTKAGT
jgi:hypothetical protein